MNLVISAKQIVIIWSRKKYFEDISYEWLRYKENQIKQSSYYNYKFIVERYLVPYFGEKNIKKLHEFNPFVDELSTYLAPKTIRDIFSVLKMILTYYEETYNKKLRYKKTILPKLEKKEIEIFTSKERDKIESYCIEQDILKSIGILICLNTGMRLGELCALRWKNIDLNEKCFYIRETAQRVYKGKKEKSKVIIGTPKTKCSIRTIPMNSKIYNILKSLSKKYKKESFFLTGTEKCIEPRNYQDYFEKLLAKVKVKKRNFHALRHTMASNCIEVGMDIKTLSKILGHANVQITMNTYVHSSRKQMKKFLDKL
ncbi:MAG: site-specific integrase [Clostridia bacterium]|nr:site-specific integrase [Clostridia bacterium]